MHVTFAFAFSSRFAKIQTYDFRKVVRQHAKGMVGNMCLCWKFTSLSRMKEF